MKTFISDLIPKLQRFSQKLDNLTLLTNQHWVVFDDIRRAAADASDTQKAQLEALIGRLEPKFDYNNEGGAILLGVKKPVVKGHGAATDKTVYNTVKIAYGLAKNNLVEKISEEFEKK